MSSDIKSLAQIYLRYLIEKAPLLISKPAAAQSIRETAILQYAQSMRKKRIDREKLDNLCPDFSRSLVFL